MDGNYSCRGCWSRAWEGTWISVSVCWDTASCWPCHTPGDPPWAAGGVCDPPLPGRVTGMCYLWVWVYWSARLEGLVVCSAGPVQVAWAAARVQHWCSDQQSLHIPVDDDPHESQVWHILKCGCILLLLRDIIYWWPWHCCVNGWALTWVSLCSLGTSVQVLEEVKFQSRCW